MEFQDFDKETIGQSECRVLVIFRALSLEEQKTSAIQFKKELERLIENYGKERIWQNEGFTLNSDTIHGTYCLFGSTDFGDCIADEWWIVWLLFEASRTVKNAFCRVIDSDGEFLLIEAAFALPKWIDEDNSDYRVWIHDGNVLLLRPNGANLQEYERCDPLSRSEAIKQINLGENFDVPARVNKGIRQRLQEYPETANNHHRAVITIPRSIAYLLRKDRNLVSKAITAFYYRDPISEKECDCMQKFYPNDLVTMTVCFTPLLYAQLAQQRTRKYAPFQLPLQGEEPAFTQAELGMKLACGFEILYNSNEQEEAKKSIDQLLEGAVFPTDDELKTLPLINDDTSFMNVDPDDLEDMLNSRIKDLEGSQSAEDSDFAESVSSADDQASNASQSKMTKDFNEHDLKDIISKIEDFVESDGSSSDRPDIYGIENSEEDEEKLYTYDPGKRDEFSLNHRNAESDDDNIEFNEDEFFNILKKPTSDTMAKSNPSALDSASSESSEDELPGNMTLQEYMQAMDEELKSQKVGNKEGAPEPFNGESSELGIDMNLAMNLIEGIQANPDAYGGPISTLLDSLNIQVPKG
ncbi:SGT1 family transcriptional regulator Sgt1 [Schizosaccharomyces cryophilus OY26]|uniref:SGT1 family transcriptional regulator Sgt1 n=1 Tax=Schizosaccharomyces cryophilus (strain OY26 / ATCC MYA-4695 / CBS 11777 / NBRC 106824 / NRRL Y48691) TaxID=653667 RepID=S9XIC4_SCHCR|nr:SGT1 family transcriptional regulator Sgt1 [Schizosaccharomyces cryophilus OY26]EPY53416.1 SGT1 family transcriptional regulator Sgt1 [Schizosaccharomyces cryophilus OY26]